jgi:hypothetical protein
VFLDLNNTRGSNGFGVNPINYQELYSYCKLYNLELDEWEIELIKRLDSVVLELHNKRQEAEQKRQAKKK